MAKKAAAQAPRDSTQDEQFYRGVRELLAELPTSDDIVIITLKAHLVIEQLLVQAMESAAHDPAPIKDLNRLQFSTRVALVESLLLPSHRGDGIWPLVKKLGKIRNDIAHQLKPKKLDEQIDTFVGLYIECFGAQLKPPVPKSSSIYVVKDRYYLIPRHVRSGTKIERYRNALAGTAQGLTGVVSVVRDNARIGWGAVKKERTKS